MKRNSPILLIAVPLMIILLGAFIYQYGYLRIQSEVTDMKDAAYIKSKILQKYVTLIADRPRIEGQLIAAREARKADNAKMVEGQTAPVAAASLQNTVKEMIISRGGSISSERAEKPEAADPFEMINVTIDAIVPDVRALGETLHAIETQTPVLVIREVDVRIRNFKEPRDLTVKLKVSGLTEGR
jgi:hypothetical protein